MSVARIYQPSKTAMQSGMSKTKTWVLDFDPESARAIDPLMGWTSSMDMSAQVRLTFDSQDEAIAYAERNGIPYRVLPTTRRKQIRKTYTDNFAYGRRRPWTH